MKNSPDPESHKKLEERLAGYTEMPDDDVWNRIKTQIDDEPAAVWIPWVQRTAAVIPLLILVWSLTDQTNHLPQVTESQSSRQQELPVSDEFKNQPTVGGTPRRDAPMNERKPLTAPSANPADRKTDSLSSTVLAQSLSTLEKSSEPMILRATRDQSPMDGGVLILSDTLNEQADTSNKQKNEIDSVHQENRKTPVVPPRKRRIFLLYGSVSTSLVFQKLTPFSNDGFRIQSFYSRPVLSGDRLGFSIEAGMQTKLTARLEMYTGVSLFSQSQTLVYQYYSDDMSASREVDFEYTVTPGTVRRSVAYNMINAGVDAGLMYYVAGDRLMHKFGAGLSWQHGMRKVSDGETYDNAGSHYLLYQLFYRNEFSVNNRVSVFVQPFYKHMISSAEALREPFEVRWYHAGLTFGVVCRMK